MSTSLDIRTALVLGAGVSGRAAARLLAARGIATTLTARKEPADVADLVAAGVVWRPGDPVDVLRAWQPARLEYARVVASPGIPSRAPELVVCAQAGIRVMGELELGAACFSGRMIAVTGSKGKSSLVKLLADALTACGIPSLACGNYGRALSGVAALRDPPAVAVAECSSFQLERLGAHVKPTSAVVLNLSRDHLDRHGTLDAYREAKLNVFQNMEADSRQLLPARSEDPYGLNDRYAQRYTRHAIPFGLAPEARWRSVPGGVEAADGFSVDLSGGYFDNAVLGPAAAAACCLLDGEGLTADQIAAAFRAFVPLPHRMQGVARFRGVAFINDSKATSLAALLAGARMAPKPVFLIAGGRLKEKIQTTGKEVVTNGVQKAYLIGECMHEMASAWSPELPVERCKTLDVAVLHAFRDATPGGSVLLAPGTASFDQFTDYEARGDWFAECVRDLIQHAEMPRKTSKTER